MEYSYYDEEYVYRDNGKILTPSQVLNLLDDLNNKNKQLKQAISDWKDSYDELYSDNKILEKENEQLKSTVEEMIKIFNDSGLDYCLSDNEYVEEDIGYYQVNIRDD